MSLPHHSVLIRRTNLASWVIEANVREKGRQEVEGIKKQRAHILAAQDQPAQEDGMSYESSAALSPILSAVKTAGKGSLAPKGGT